MNDNHDQHRQLLQKIARRAMLEKGLLPDFSAEALAELSDLKIPASLNNEPVRDLRGLLWASLDNDDSRDLDQLTSAEGLPGGGVKIFVAVADVDMLVKNGSAIDGHARHNTTSVYTAARTFPMLPEKLSTGLTSLNFNEDRRAIVIEMAVDANGSLQKSDIYRANVRNRAKLAYTGVAAWLDERGSIPAALASVPGFDEVIRMQDRVAQSMKKLRHQHGALSLETSEARPVFEGDVLRGLEAEQRNRAKDIIEDFMIAANGVIARFLSSRKLSSLRRVVRTPKRWERIVALGAEHGFTLPPVPDSLALEEFLTKERTADALRFPDLSLAVIKLLGAGEYVAEFPGVVSSGHFGLAVRDYTHSTAPNRRYIDLITQRLLKAAIEGTPSPYNNLELELLAAECTKAEDAANKVERQVRKSAAAMLLERRIGEEFEAIVTGAAEKGTWARLLTIPVEGRLVQGFEGLDVGSRIRVQLASVDVQRGFIDLRKI